MKQVSSSAIMKYSFHKEICLFDIVIHNEEKKFRYFVINPSEVIYSNQIVLLLVITREVDIYIITINAYRL